MQKRNNNTLAHSLESTPESEGRVSFYPIAPEDNIPVSYHNDFARGLSKMHFTVDIDSVNGQQITIISKRL